MSPLHQARFFTTADALDQLPLLGLPEVAFAGRSNAGKSSAINALTHQKRLAFTSKTPGRTQHINFFAVGEHAEDDSVPAAFLVDLPGYGYAQVGRSSQRHWEALLGAYVRLRTELAGIVLIMDARHPMTALDETLLDWFGATGKPVHALLTKADKLNRSDQAQALAATRAALAKWHPAHTAQLFSSLKREGLEEADTRVLALLGIASQPLTSSISKKNAPTQGE